MGLINVLFENVNLIYVPKTRKINFINKCRKEILTVPLFEIPEISFTDSALRVLCKVTAKRYYLLCHGLKKNQRGSSRW